MNDWRKFIPPQIKPRYIYTIKDLSEGRCAVINDGTHKELIDVLNLAFPNRCLRLLDYSYQYYFKSISGMVSFSGHYHNRNHQSVKDFLINKNETMKSIKLTLEQAKELYQDEKWKDVVLNSFYKEELEKPNLPSSCFKDLRGRVGAYIGHNSEIFLSEIYCRYDVNVFDTEEQAKAVLSLAQLSHHINIWNDGWTPNWSDGSLKYCIYYRRDEIDILEAVITSSFLSFKTKEIATKFVWTFKDLIEQAKPLL